MPIQPQTALGFIDVFHCFAIPSSCVYSKSLVGNLIGAFGGPCLSLALTESE